jgi:hypothetical protein
MDTRTEVETNTVDIDVLLPQRLALAKQLNKADWQNWEMKEQSNPDAFLESAGRCYPVNCRRSTQAGR